MNSLITAPASRAGTSPVLELPTYWHGGAPGLALGSWLLPPAVTGTAVTLAAYMDAGDRLRAGYRRDRVYVVTQYEAAELYAAMYPEGGCIYRVLPWLPLEEDPDCTEPGLSYACTAARIVEVVQPDPLTVFSILSAVMDEAGGAR